MRFAMAKQRDSPPYRIYLLAVWRASTDEPATAETWRFYLEDPHTGRRVGFTNADALLTALQEGSWEDGEEATCQA